VSAAPPGAVAAADAGDAAEEDAAAPQEGGSAERVAREEAGDHAMTRSEEEVQIGKADRERSRVRLKKYVVTDYVEKTILVKREEVRWSTSASSRPDSGA